MAISLTQPAIGSVNWGTAVNANWQALTDAFQTSATFSGSLTVSGATALNGTVSTYALTVKDATGGWQVAVLSSSGSAAGLELGRIDGTAASAFIDFHSSTSLVDFNARLLVTGNTAQALGNMQFTAGTYFFTATAATSGAPNAFVVQRGANTGQTASTEAVDVYFNLTATATWAAGTIATQRAFLIGAPTYAFASASTITNAVTFSITGAPIAGTNATLTSSYAMWVQAGKVLLSETTAASSSTGAFIVGTGTTATTVFIGGGKIYAGASVNADFYQSNNTSQTQPGLDLTPTTAGRISIGNIEDISALSYATGYVGFNAARTASNSWAHNGDGANNGASVAFGTILGAYIISCLPSTGTGTSTRTDAQILAAGIAVFQPTTTSFAQQVATSGSPTAWTFAAAAHTTLTLSVEAPDVNFNLARTVQFAQGALTTQRAFLVQAPTYAFATGSSTLTNAATFAITGAPIAGTNATLTNSYALWVQGGKALFDDTTEATSATVAALAITGGLAVAKRSFLGTIGSTFKGNVLAGVQDGTAAVAGQVGEVLTANTSTFTNCAASTVYKQFETLSLSPGDWDIHATVTYYINNASALTNSAGASVAISTTTASAAGTVEGKTIVWASGNTYAGSASAKMTLSLRFQLSLSATTSYYLNGQLAYNVGTMQYASHFWARRIR